MTIELEQMSISWIEHFAYCERQWGLISIEQVFDDNESTVRGHLTHRFVDTPGGVSRPGVRAERALPLWSNRLGLYGKADLVEFRGDVVFPVEYKSGRRAERPAVLQLAAQALCLEEMLGVQVPEGAIYLAATRDRVTFEITEDVRQDLEQTVDRLRCAHRAGRLGEPVDDARCGLCSLRDRCLPSLVRHPQRVRTLAAGTYRV